MACEDKINLDGKLNPGAPELVIDAFIADYPEKQKIVLSNTQFFYDNSTQKLVSGAIVQVTDMTRNLTFDFSESEQGTFYSNQNGDSILKIGNQYRLTVKYQGNTYSADSKMNRVVPIDAIHFLAAEKPNGDVIPGKYDVEFFARDAVGLGDRYWVRFYRNGRRNTDGSRIGIAYDAGFGSNSVVDGDVFILPIRRFIVSFDEEKDKWVDGENIRIELYSVTNPTADFLAKLSTQTNLNGGLFSQPQANITTNIVNSSPNGMKAVGWFSTSAATSAGTVVPVPFN